VVGLIIAAFFIVLGIITVDRVALVSWVGPNPSVIATWSLAGHHYVLSNEMLRVSAFSGRSPASTLSSRPARTRRCAPTSPRATSDTCGLPRGTARLLDVQRG